MLLGELHETIRETIKRGSAYDAFIPRYVKQAVQFIERNYDFKYMERLTLIQTVAGDRVVEIPYYIKGVEFIRLVTSTPNSNYNYMTAVEARSQIRPETGAPSEFWRLGHNKLVFNPIPDASSYAGEALLKVYTGTDWPTKDDSRHYLLDVAPDLLIAETMLKMAVTVLRDARMVEGYKMMRDEALNTLTRAEDELRFSGADYRMGYQPYSPV